MKKKVTLQEMRNRTKGVKERIYYLKKCNIRIYYRPELINNVIFMEKYQFESLVKNLELFERILIEDKKLEKFKYSLWEIDIQDNKVLFISKNKSIKKELTLKINLNDDRKLIITRRIL